MEVELVFNRNELNLNGGEVKDLILKKLTSLSFPLLFKVKSVTVMSSWLVVLLDFPLLKTHPHQTELIFDAIAGEFVRALIGYGVRYRHFTVIGEGESLIFKEKTHQ